MKYIKSPEDIAVVSTVTGEPIRDENNSPATLSFAMFVKQRLLDAKYGASMDMVGWSKKERENQ
jgi:hypothetical protein